MAFTLPDPASPLAPAPEHAGPPVLPAGPVAGKSDPTLRVLAAGRPLSGVRPEGPQLCVYDGPALARQLPRLEAYVTQRERVALGWHPAWSLVLSDGFRHAPYFLEALKSGKTCGVLALAHVRSLLFGNFLVSLPYLNYGGVLADDDRVARRLIDRAIELADELGVRYLELRHTTPIEHTGLQPREGAKVTMHLALPETPGQLWDQLLSKMRNHVRKAHKHGVTIAWGTDKLLEDFYEVFSQNMRDLGTPVYGREIYRQVLRRFPDRAEFCVARLGGRPVAAALLLHGWGITEVPNASSLREVNPTCANNLLYWHLLERAIERKQALFDFGRCTPDSNTYVFKKQWGATPVPCAWQYYVRHGSVGEMNADNPRYQRFVRWWQRLPVRLTRLIGPPIVRGIP